MPAPLYTQTVIAFVWDFDKTLIPSNMQDPIFDLYGVDRDDFWSEVEGLVDYYDRNGVVVQRDTVYLGHLLTYVREGVFDGLSNEKLRELGKDLTPVPGMPDFMETTRQRVDEIPEFTDEGITVEHYIVSTGLREMIEGSVFGGAVDGVWANTFIEDVAEPGGPDQPDRVHDRQHVKDSGDFRDQQGCQQDLGARCQRSDGSRSETGADEEHRLHCRRSLRCSRFLDPQHVGGSNTRRVHH